MKRVGAPLPWRLAERAGGNLKARRPEGSEDNFEHFSVPKGFTSREREFS